MKKVLYILCITIITLSACDNTDINEDSVLTAFISLNADSDTIMMGKSTTIKAEVEGKGVSFLWSATSGDILGSGAEVTYVAPPCTPGNNTIRCTAKAANKEENKNIVITVL